MKNLLRLCLVAAALFVAQFALPSNADAACAGAPVHGGVGTCYGIVTGNWATSGTWSATPGGASCACVPATGDDIVLDGFSGSATFTISASISVNSFDTNDLNAIGDSQGPFAGTLAHSSGQTLTIANNATAASYFYLGTHVSYTGGSARIISFNATTGTSGTPTQIWTNPAHNVLFNITFNGTGGYFELEDGLNVYTGGAITFTAGTVDATTNNPNVTAGSVSAGAGAVNCGTGTWTLTQTQNNIWSATGTMSCGSAAFVITPSGAIPGSRTFATNGATFGALTVSSPVRRR